MQVCVTRLHVIVGENLRMQIFVVAEIMNQITV